MPEGMVATRWSAPARPAAVERSRALDIARGIAIVLVVWGHAMIGTGRALGAGEAGRFAVILVYGVHMPLFFFLSGLLARRAMTEPAPDFARRLSIRLAYPYFLWSAVLLSAHHAMSGVTNTRVEQLDFLTLFYAPPAVMWFLYVLCFCFLLARAMAGRPGARLALGCALAVGGYFAQGWMLPNLRFVGMFLIATTLTPAGVLATVRDRRVQMLGAALMVPPVLFALREAGQPPGGYPAFALRYLPAAVGGTVLILAAAEGLARRGAALALVGRRTMPIFVTHILVLTAARILCLRAGMGGGATVAVATACGVAAPMLLHAAAERFGLTRLLGWGRGE